MGFDDVIDLLLPASAFALIAFADTIASARTYAVKNGYEIDPNRELAGLGGANLASGISAAFPISGSGSRTALNDSTGGSTQLVGIATAALVAVIALFATPLIEPLPDAALGVVVVVAAVGLFEVSSVWRLRRVRDAELGLAVAALVGVLLFGVLGGVAVAVGLSIAVFVYRSVRPHDAVLASVDDVDGYHDIVRYADAETLPGLVVYRFDAPLFFPNAEYFRERVLGLVDAERVPGVVRPERRGLHVRRCDGDRRVAAASRRACRARCGAGDHAPEGSPAGDLRDRPASPSRSAATGSSRRCARASTHFELGRSPRGRLVGRPSDVTPGDSRCRAPSARDWAI